MSGGKCKFVKPIDGDVLFSTADGEARDGGLYTVIRVSAPVGRKIEINGVEATEQDGSYYATVFLDGYRNSVEALDRESGELQTIFIYWFRNGYKTYRLGVDDVIRCFENIYQHQEEYTTIFEDPFLALYRDLHETYGTYVHMHIYYENDDGSFNLSMFPDKYKAEFQANGDWLKFTFHSRKDKPDSPYKFASYEQVMREGKQVEAEILRFAGPEVFSDITSQHWADSNLYATRAFRNLGYRCIDGYFIFDEKGEPAVSYYLNKEQTEHAHQRDFWVDNQENIIFVKDDIIINEVDLEEIDAFMENISSQEDHCFHYLLIHEQYFYEDYIRYEPDYRERIFRTVDWCHRNGYRPATISSVALEPAVSLFGGQAALLA